MSEEKETSKLMEGFAASLLGAMFFGYFGFGFGSELTNSKSKRESLIPEEVNEEYNKLCEGKSDEEKAEIFEEMKKTNPFLRNFFSKLGDSEEMDRLINLLRPFDDKAVELDNLKIRVIHKWVNNEDINIELFDEKKPTEDYAWGIYCFVEEWKAGKFGEIPLKEALDNYFEIF